MGDGVDQCVGNKKQENIYKIMLTMGNQFYPNILCLCQLSILLTANIFTLTKVVHYQIPENSIILKKRQTF